MTSKIKVDNINKVSDDSNIINKCGTNITMGQNGDTVIIPNGVTEQVQSGGAIQVQSGGSITIASGATITNNGTAVGLGRTGTVDWQTGSIKTATFTAANGEGYFCNTAGGTFEVDLPAGVAGAIVSIQDYNNTFDSNSLTVDPNGSEKINGGDAGFPLILSTEGQGLTLVYIDATVGWRSVQSDDFSQSPSSPAFVTATGGTITTVCTNFKVHTFTGPGTFCVSNAGNIGGSNTVDYMIVAGGGGGGNNGGGAGAGGFRESSGIASGSYTASPLGACVSAVSVLAQSYPITVGGGGNASTNYNSQNNTSGNNSQFNTITSAGGGKGAGYIPGGGSNGGTGGSGGGAGCASTLGAGNTPPVSPPQGNPGSASGGPSGYGAGGGATQAGNVGVGPTSGGIGGNGATTSINGTPTTRAGGGGGAGFGSPSGGSGYAGGTGGGGAGSGAEGTGTAGTVNTGGGGGGAAGGGAGPSGAGGSGIVMIRYKFQ